jgi:hypothetical protein
MTIRTILMLIAALLFTTPATAVMEKTTATVIAQQSNNLKKEIKMEKRLSFFQKLLKKATDPDQKWLWLGLSGLVLGGLSYFIALVATHANNAIFPFLAKLGVVLIVLGIVFLVIWLVKKIA